MVRDILVIAEHIDPRPYPLFQEETQRTAHTVQKFRQSNNKVTIRPGENTKIITKTHLFKYIYREFYHQNLKTFRRKHLEVLIFLLKT